METIDRMGDVFALQDKMTRSVNNFRFSTDKLLGAVRQTAGVLATPVLKAGPPLGVGPPPEVPPGLEVGAKLVEEHISRVAAA